MAILAPLLAMAGRMFGKIFNTLFGWATITLFGRVPEGRQGIISLIGLGSVVWLVLLAGIAFPRFGAFILSFAPIPDWVNDNWVRIAMFGGAVLLPVAVGALSIFAVGKDQRPKGAKEIARACIKGYPHTLGIALAVFVPVLKIKPLFRRWSSQHMPVLVEARDYGEVIEDAQEALAEAGWKTTRSRASWMLRLPTAVLTFFAAGPMEKMLAKQLTSLNAKGLEVMLHPSDLVITGPKGDVHRARAVLAERLAFSKGHLTWTKEANELEDRIQELWRLRMDGRVSESDSLRDLQIIEETLREASLPYEEWEALFRAKLMVEQSILSGRRPARRRGLKGVVSAVASGLKGEPV